MMTLEVLDLPAWVALAYPDKRQFREAVHIVLTAIGTSVPLRSKMIMKGGLLMAIRYESTRFTKDADFSTRDKFAADTQEELLDELDAQLANANEQLTYDTMCRRQRTEVRPARPGAQFPTLSLSIGYAQRSKPAERTRLMSGKAPSVVQIDYSYNEAVYDIEILALEDGEALQVYSFLNLVAEKMRSLLQQPQRNRHRRQDIYDLNLLITSGTPLSTEEQQQLLKLLVTSCRERTIEPTKNSFAVPQIKQMSQQGYEDLAPEIEGALPQFETAYATVQNFYESLPWDSVFLADIDSTPENN